MPKGHPRRCQSSLGPHPSFGWRLAHGPWASQRIWKKQGEQAPNYAADHPYVQRGYHSYGSNQWPEALPELATQSRTYIAAMRQLALRLMQLLALSLDLPEDYFDHTHQSPMLTLRLLRYPPHPESADALTFGAVSYTHLTLPTKRIV